MYYSHQGLVLPCDTSSICQPDLAKWLTLIAHFGTHATGRVASLGTLIAKRSIFETVMGEPIDAVSILVSSLNRYIKDILFQLERLGLPWLAISDDDAPVFSIIFNDQIVRIRNREGAPYPTISSAKRWIEMFESELFIVPSLALYFLCLFAIPRIAHFGNSYGFLDRATKWAKDIFQSGHQRLSIGPDGTNCIPVCFVNARTAYRKQRTYSLYSLDHFMRQEESYRGMVTNAAETGKSNRTTILI
jgi:hypothetical protein